MNTTPPEQTSVKPPVSFVSQERGTAMKTEFFNGRSVTKPASNRWHNLISSNFTIAVGSRAHGGKCEIYSGDMRVKIGSDSICYPDVVILGTEPEFADSKSDMLLNPTVIVEVFSSKTNTSDRTLKLEGYLAVPSVKECLLVKEDEMRVEHYTRQNAKQWIYRIYNERDDVITLDPINCKISLSEIYAQIRVKGSDLASVAVN